MEKTLIRCLITVAGLCSAFGAQAQNGTGNLPAVKVPKEQKASKLTTLANQTAAKPDMNPNAFSAGGAAMQAAFEKYTGREASDETLLRATEVVIEGQTYQCVSMGILAKYPLKLLLLDSDLTKNWDCESPIVNWLIQTQNGRAEYQGIFERVYYEVFGHYWYGGAMVVPTDVNEIWEYKILAARLTKAMYELREAEAAQKAGGIGGGGGEVLAPCFPGPGRPGSCNKSLPAAQNPQKQRTVLYPETVITEAYKQVMGKNPTDAQVNDWVGTFRKQKAGYKEMHQSFLEAKPFLK